MVRKTVLIPRDCDIQFPEFTIIAASAGSGKTHTLTLKVLQILLSRIIPLNDLRHIIAMTFTNNAAAEMKYRILAYLKKLSLDERSGQQNHNPSSITTSVMELVSLDEPSLRQRSEEVLQTIFDTYDDFQITTIDSFLTRIFRSTAVELGLSPGYTITLDEIPALEDALEEFLDSALTHTATVELITTILDDILQQSSDDSKYPWDPYRVFSKHITKLFRPLAHYYGTPARETNDISGILEETKKLWDTITTRVRNSNLTPTTYFEAATEALEEGAYDRFFLGARTFNTPVKKPKTKKDELSYTNLITECTPALKKLRSYAARYAEWKALMKYQPYLQLYEQLQPFIEGRKQREGEIALTDITRALATMLKEETVPEIYFYLGEELRHFLIDEFQDTSPLQWLTLRPLCENALANNGTLFLVGDTKQSIFSFRGADWQIMKRLMERDEFPSAPTHRLPLTINYRSSEAIVSYVRKTFQEHVPAVLDPEVGEAATLSGLQQDVQTVVEEQKNRGSVRVVKIPAAEDEPERKELIATLRTWQQRGFGLGEMAILTTTNEEAMTVSAWLNAEHIDFVSYSTLDVRNRKIIQELLALLKFLDSPTDGNSFATVLLGEVFQKNLAGTESKVTAEMLHTFLLECGNAPTAGSKVLYREFQKHYPDLWQQYFAEPFRLVGYLSLYDLVVLLVQTFRMYELFEDEEASITRFLETLCEWEREGKNNLKEFLLFALETEDEAPWTLEAPAVDAVTITTIHKAKGLGFPLVLLLLYDRRLPNTNLCIEENGDTLRLWWVTRETAEYSQKIAELRNQRLVLRTVDELNKLYVALTRAKTEMVVLNIIHPKYKTYSLYLPDESVEYSQESPAGRTTSKGTIAETYHPQTLVEIEAHAREALRWEERRRGDAVHALLANVKFLQPNIELQLRTIVAQNSELRALNEFTNDLLLRSLTEFLSMPEIAPLFIAKPQREVLCEEEFVDRQGQLFRMDRVVIDEAEVTVLDYKTGHEKPEYEKQIRSYMEILKELYPQCTVKGVLAYIDEKKVRWFL